MERKIEYRFAPLKLDEGERKVLGTAVPWGSIGQGDFGPEDSCGRHSDPSKIFKCSI